MRLKKLIPSIALLFTMVFQIPTVAQAEGSCAKCWAGWQFEGENDSLAAFSGSDEYYTNGIRFSWVRNPQLVPNPKWVETFIRQQWPRIAPKLILDSRPDIGYGHAFGQNFYTPETITDPSPRPDDRPWAGYLYYSWLVQATYPTTGNWKTDQPVQNLFEVQVGIVGPEAGAEAIQSWFHRVIDDDQPLGWSNEVETEPTLNLIYLWRRKLGTTSVDIVPHGGVALGNVATFANGGATVRVGHNLSSFPQLQITPTNGPVDRPPTSVATPALPKTEFYVFLGVDGRYVAHNIFLDGNTFRDDGPEIDIDKKRFVYDLKAGLSFRRKCWRFDYTFVRRSEEFDPPPSRADGLHDFGSFAISRVFWRP